MVIPFWVSFAIQAVVTVLSIADQRKRAKKARQEAAARAESAKGLTIPTEGESAPLTVYYGRNKMGGNRVYHNTLNSYVYSEPPSASFKTFDAGTNMHASISGSKHEFLVFQQAIGFGGMSDVKHLLINDKSFNVAEYQYGSLVNYCLGGSLADPLLAANVVSRTTAYFTNASYFTGFFRLNRDDAQFSSVPSVQTLGDGLAVRSILGAAGTRYFSSSRAYSNNPALVLADYLTNSVYGRGLAADKLDLDTFYDAAVVCDRVIVSNAPKDGLYWANTVEQRDVRLYEANIGLDSAKTIRDNIEALLETMAGAELVWSGGVYKLKLYYPEVWSGGAVYNLGDVVQDGVGANVDLYRCVAGPTTQPTSHADWAKTVVSAYVTDDDIIRKGENSIAWPNAQSRFNYVTVRFLNEAKEFAEDSVSWPPKSGAVYLQYLAEDFNSPLETDFFESGITDYYHAMAKAEQRCRLSRDAVVYKFTVGANLSGLEPADIVKVNSTVLGIPGELMSVEEIKVQQNGNAELQCVKFDAEQLAWNAPDEQIVAPRNVYDTVIEQATGLLYNPVNSEQSNSSGLLTWNNASDSRVLTYKVKITEATLIDDSTIWRELTVVGKQTNSSTTRYSLPPLEAGTYKITVVSCTLTGVAERSAWPILEIATPIIAEGSATQTLLRIYRRDASTPAAPSGGSFSFTTYILSSVPANWSPVIPTGNDTVYISEAVAVDPGGGGVDNTLTWTTPSVFLAGDVSAYLTEPVVGVSQNTAGTNVYTAAIGAFKVFNGTLDVTATAAPVFSIVATDGVALTLSNTTGATKGEYAVTGLTKDKGSATLRCVYLGVTTDVTLSVVLVGSARIRDLTAPPVPTGLTAVSTTTTTYITQTAPAYTQGHGHGYTEIWASTSAVSGTSVKIDQFAGNNYNIPIPVNQVRFMWFKWVSQDGVASGLSATPINVSSSLIQTAEISPSAINSALLAEGTVTQSKFSTADINNLVFNPDFSTGDTRSWNTDISGGGAIDVVPRATVGVPAGSSTTNVLRVAHTGGVKTAIISSDSNYTASGLVGGVPVTAGEQFRLSFECASSVGGTGNITAKVIVKTVTGALSYPVVIDPSVTTGWVMYGVDATVGATGRLYLSFEALAGAVRTLFITNVKLHKRSTSDLIADGAIITSKLAANSVVASNITSDAVTADKIVANAITATKIAADAVTADKIVANAITATKIAADAVTSDKIVANAISTDKLSTNSVSSDKIQAGAVVASKLSVGQLDAITATIGVLRTATSGARMELRDNAIKVYDAANTLRVQLGDLNL